MNCKDCWQYDVCNPPEEVIHIGCEFHSKIRPTEQEANEKALDKALDYDYDVYISNESQPIGSCEMCGANIYIDDVNGICDQCEWSVEASNGRIKL